MTKRWMPAALLMIWPTLAIAQLRATATESALSFGGATILGKVAVCRIANVRVDGVEDLARQQSITTADSAGNGSVQGETPAFRAVWLVVDMTTGHFAVATPPGYRSSPIAPPSIPHPGIASFVWSRPLVEVYAIRPHLGIWHGIAAFGTQSDGGHDRAGHATFTVAQLRAKPGDPDPPAVLTPGDVLLIVDPTWMVYSVTTVPLGAPNAN
jgi:hypothetical protein